MSEKPITQRIKDRLAAYTAMLRDIDNQLERLDRMEMTMASPPGPDLTGMPRGSGTPSDRTGMMVERKMELEEQIDRLKAEEKQERNAIEGLILQLSDPDERAVIRLRYFDRADWESTCGVLFGDRRDYVDRVDAYEHLNSDYTTETRYNPDGAQARYEANLRAKGPDLKIGNDHELADYLIVKIRDEKYSPEAAIGEAEVKGWPFKTHICASTAYNYIRGEIFGDELTVSMLPQHGKRHQPERPAGSMPRKPAGRSIEERPEHINNRSTFGHWEMDSVESCQGVSNTYIVMTERKTRWELIIPSPDKTAASVVAAIDGLEAKYGDLFSKVFRSITCDNGCEFADAAGIERSASGKGARTEVYYCHPYRPSERGSNENQNGLIRRHVPKGTDLSTISDEETKRIEAWLNNYPRKMFGYLCSEQLFREEMALILAS